jgi:hypothetical protein
MDNICHPPVRKKRQISVAAKIKQMMFRTLV